MGKLRRFEIDAIVQELQHAAEVKNKELLSDFEESSVEEKLRSDYPDIVAYFEECERIQALERSNKNTLDLLRVKYKGDDLVSSHLGVTSKEIIKKKIRKQLQEEYETINIDQSQIERKIILHGQSDLQECLTSIKGELGL